MFIRKEIVYWLMVSNLPKVSISGIRGQDNYEFLTIAEHYIDAFLREHNGVPILYCQDTRGNQYRVKALVRCAAGYCAPFIDLGIAPTPTIQLLARDIGVNGIAGTASHNPHPDIGAKLFTEGGMITKGELMRLEQRISSPQNSDGKYYPPIFLQDVLSASPIICNWQFSF